MNVSAVIVTRGDVELAPVLDSLPEDWERVVWDNGHGVVSILGSDVPWKSIKRRDAASMNQVGDLLVYGRYSAIRFATHPLIYVQDDDCIVSDPQAIADQWVAKTDSFTDEHVVCNMPAAFQNSFYAEHGLVGFGAAFHRDAPTSAFSRFWRASMGWAGETRMQLNPGGVVSDFFHRTCDIVFTTLTPRVLVDVAYEDREFASAPNRMWRQPTHREERARMLELALQVRDAT